MKDSAAIETKEGARVGVRKDTERGRKRGSSTARTHPLVTRATTTQVGTGPP